MIAIINYGCGNIRAFLNAFTRLNIAISVATRPEDLKNATHLILPGVGAFDYVIRYFNQSGLREEVEKKVLEDKVPVLGICAGMQILANSSEEGIEKGLSWIPGKVRRFDISQIPDKTKVPHMGWNEIIHNDSNLFKNVEPGSRYYFVHSYYFEPTNESDSIATSNYGFEFSAAVANQNIYGVQFHPEKSHLNGMKLLKNFAELC